MIKIRRVSRAGSFTALLLGSLVISGCGVEKKASETQTAALPVSVLNAELEKIPLTLKATGQAEGSKAVEVRARVGGILTEQLYPEGTPVVAGQPLFALDTPPFEIALARAKGQLAEQQARAVQAKRETKRLQSLLSERAISQKEYDDALANYAVAEASVKSAEAEVRKAELDLSYTTVTAPVSGISGRAEYSEGALVTAGATGLLTTIVQTDPMWVRFGVSEKELLAMHESSGKDLSDVKVEVVLSNGKTYGKVGKLNFEATEVDRQLGTVALRAELDNAMGTLIPGQFLRVRLTAADREVVLLPHEAVMQNEAGHYVFLADSQGKVQSRRVVTDGWWDGNWVVLEGLSAGERVITDNLIRLSPGMMIKVDNVVQRGNLVRDVASL